MKNEDRSALGRGGCSSGSKLGYGLGRSQFHFPLGAGLFSLLSPIYLNQRCVHKTLKHRSAALKTRLSKVFTQMIIFLIIVNLSKVL